MTPEEIVRDLLSKPIQSNRQIQVDTEEEAKAIVSVVPKVNENYVGYYEEIGVDKKMLLPSLKKVIGPYGERSYEKGPNRWQKVCVSAFVVWIDLSPEIHRDALMNSLKEFGRENNIESIQIGNDTIDPNDDYE